MSLNFFSSVQFAFLELSTPLSLDLYKVRFHKCMSNIVDSFIRNTM